MALVTLHYKAILWRYVDLWGVRAAKRAKFLARLTLCDRMGSLRHWLLANARTLQWSFVPFSRFAFRFGDGGA